MKLLIVLHIFYYEQVWEFIEKLFFIDKSNTDLYITLTESKVHNIYKKIILQAFPNARVIFVKNCGWDIWPFLNIINSVNLNEYDYVLKLHTKSRSYGYRYYYYNSNFFWVKCSWRDELIKSLIGSREIFESNLKVLKKQDNGMISNGIFIAENGLHSNGMFFNALQKECLRIGICINDMRDVKFVAGTMFLCRSNILKPIQFKYGEKDFNPNTLTNRELPYLLERIFGILAVSQHYKIVPSPLNYTNYTKISKSALNIRFLIAMIKIKLQYFFSLISRQEYEILINNALIKYKNKF